MLGNMDNTALDSLLARVTSTRSQTPAQHAMIERLENLKVPRPLIYTEGHMVREEPMHGRLDICQKIY